MRLAVDVMGGDHAPEAVLKGCIRALDLLESGDELVLVGTADLINELMREWGVSDPRITIDHAPDTIEMHESPAKAVRSKPDSSIVRMALLGSKKVDRPCDVVLSAGNTGACVAAAIMHMKRLPGVHRPGIAVTIPAFHGPIVLCDAGANPEPRATHLWQYAIMADTYSKHVLGTKNPRVALMNIGSEEGKGSDLVKEARDLLRETPDINYIGYVEGRDFFAGAADVIVTDGFVGNTILKMAEGMAKSLFEAIAQEIFELDPDLALQFEPVVKQIYAKNDYHEYGGAPLLGVNGAMMIAHGSSQPRTITAAIRNSKAFVRTATNEAIVARIAEIESRMGPVVERA
ncbi:MAG: phosphate acyltransferase PlsX [Leptolyngbya sp. PLA3]|nr:MAG: phosphate acyltransferase PlsX [Cyanobacteria bacterium CYA]MCE7969233.1 phosphate acyltransferase PlsX [Leptolyngbya sp. PL-A3]